ncbi:MAG: hypothetical protein R6U28_08120 [Cyclonatronaceae bacterium]
MLDIFKIILDVSKSLLGMSELLRNANRQSRTDMSDLFQKISTCLASVSTEIRAGGVPHGRCGELEQYALALPALLEKELGATQAQELGQTLHAAYNVESVAINLQQVHDAREKEPYLAQIEEAAGKFQALSNLVRVG